MQWPAMIATLVAAWFVASQSSKMRNMGFWIYILSNVLWVLWGWQNDGYALIALQVGLFLMNIRGIRKNGMRSQDAETFHSKKQMA